MMESKSMERQWILNRLETLSVKEQTQLAAAIISRGQLKALSEKAGDERELAVRKMDPNMRWCPFLKSWRPTEAASPPPRKT